MTPRPRAVDVPAPGAARSFWLQEALAHDPGERCPPLEADLAADVCVIGGGFCGLWAAVALTERDPGLRVVLLERDIVGGGASGRNGGFFSSSWWDLPAIVGLFGEEDGLRYARVLGDAIGEAGAFIGDNSLDCWWHEDGTLSVTTGAWQGRIAQNGAIERARRLGVGDRLRPITGEAARAVADSPRFLDGAVSADGATVQPARLARELRRVLLDRGVRIFERTQVRGIDRSRPAIVRTAGGAVRSPEVVLATGSWAAAWPGFRRSFGVVVDTMVVTEPIPDRIGEIGWTGNEGIVDGRELLFYLRRTDDDRIAIGGGAMGAAWGGRADSRAVTHDRHAANVAARGLLWIFPQLGGVRFTHAWGGPIDHTGSFLPFFRTLPPGNVHAGLGFSGHGLAQTFVGGKILASLVLGTRDDEWATLPVVGRELAKTPPEPVRWPAVKTAAWALERGDAREESGRPRGRILDLIGSAPLRYRDRLVQAAERRRAFGRDQ